MLIKNLIKSIKNPTRAWRFFTFMLKFTLRKKRGILFIIGMDSNGIFDLMYRGYEKCYGFEANPERFEKLVKKYGKQPNIYIHNVAVAQYDGEVVLNISSNNNGASSSLGNFNKTWQEQYKAEKIEIVKSIKVPCINLHNFCIKNNISYIDDYLSDIQGMDLEVLKTMNPMIEQKRIGTITCEVTKNEKRNVYSDLPDNSENGFAELVNTNYELIAKGHGALKDNKFDKISKDEWEMDCKWKIKE
ncbi:MAG: FkbM family methyltransferase [Bacteroidales bacterium]|jgi:FkbM family methyltransferase